MDKDQKEPIKRQDVLVEDDRTGLSLETLKRAIVDNLLFTQARHFSIATPNDRNGQCQSHQQAKHPFHVVVLITRESSLPTSTTTGRCYRERDCQPYRTCKGNARPDTCR